MSHGVAEGGNIQGIAAAATVDISEEDSVIAESEVEAGGAPHCLDVEGAVSVAYNDVASSDSHHY